MPYLYGSDLASGGWDAIDNITMGIGRGADQNVSSFFPAQQRDKIISETNLPAGGTGQTFRPTQQENQSMLETDFWRDRGWFGSPYEDNLSVTKKTQEGLLFAARVEPKKDVLGESLDWALTQTKKVTTLFDQFSDIWEPREVIKEKPRAGYPEGKDSRNLNQTIEKGANVIKAGANVIGGIYDQVKGLFNRGFPQTGGQPAFAVKHELDPSPTLTIGIGVIAALVIFMILRKK